ncbi:hypothetical protein CYJ36_00455 [Bacillus sp. UMB0893]|nr:hypothetical protein CYJ36_00455 [Bacillus sp. UMB0893]
MPDCGNPRVKFITKNNNQCKNSQMQKEPIQSICAFVSAPEWSLFVKGFARSVLCLRLLLG